MFRSFFLTALFLHAILPNAGQDKKKPPPKQEPRVLLAVPLGATPGRTSKLTLRGANLDSATDVRIVVGKGSVKILGKGKAPVPDKNPDKVGDTKVEIELALESKLTEEFITLVVVAPTGESAPHAVPVTLTEAEKEPNDGFRTAHPVVLPVVLAGTIQRLKDVDVFRFEGKKGQTLHADVLASRHGSPLDAILTLYDASFQQMAVNDDFAKDHRDARIQMTLPADGMYYVSLIDAHDSGSELHVFRLIIK